VEGKVKFGPYEYSADSGELRKHGLRIRLQGKPREMLAALLESPGRVVSREDLRQRLWPQEPFVDVESGLNTAAKRLRDALSDSADEPRYIETVPREGYRFKGSIEPFARATPPQHASLAPAPQPFPVWIPALAALVILAAGWAWLRPGPPQVRIRQVSFQQGQAGSARFSPDGDYITYSISRNGVSHLYVGGSAASEAREIPGPGGSLVSISKDGEMAILRSSGLTPLGGSTLWRMAVNGGGAIELDRSIFSADWAPDGRELAVVRAEGGVCTLEYPRGKVLYRTSGYITNVRFSPAGDQIAFIHHPVRHDDAGSVEVTSLDGKHRVVSKDWTSAIGLAWHPNGEIWFTAARAGALRALHAVRPDGAGLRNVAQAPGSLYVHDVSRRGEVLVSRGSTRLEMAVSSLADPEPRNLSWLDWSSVKDVSPGGSLVLFEENGEGVAGKFVTYLYRREDGSTFRLGEGSAMALTQDLKGALVLDDKDRTRLRILPVGPGSPRDLPASGLHYQWARFFPGGAKLVALGSKPGRPLQLHVVDSATGAAAELAPPGMVRNSAVSPGSRQVAALSADGKLEIHSLGGGAIRTVPASEPLAPLLWTARGILVQHTRNYTHVPATVSWVDPVSGRVEPFAQVGPRDGFGVNAVTRIVIAPDALHWGFSYRRILSELFLAEGWK